MRKYGQKVLSVLVQNVKIAFFLTFPLDILNP